MSSHPDTAPSATIDFSKWAKTPKVMIVAGLVCMALGGLVARGSFTREFSYSWLTGFMFCLSFCVGGWWLVLVHHVFDASWSVPVRRLNENLACVFPLMALLFIPIALNVLFADKENLIYRWMGENPATDHALKSKLPVFTKAGFLLVAAACFFLWWLYSSRLRYWSMQQDKTGAAVCTHKMRFLSCTGLPVFAVTVTLAAIMWMKGLEHEWYSTMYGVYYFAGSVWTTLATLYVVAVILRDAGPLKEVIREKQLYFIGSLLFAFTVFYAYVHFAQYFIIWNANIPEETFYYLQREKGAWWQISMVIIFGHFFVPFLSLLRIDVKLTPVLMFALAVWAWLMHYVDMSFNVMPVLRPEGFRLTLLDIGCPLFIAGLMLAYWIRLFRASPPYPQRDPRFAEGFDVYVPPARTGLRPGGAK
jgi:hypothetical protein